MLPEKISILRPYLKIYKKEPPCVYFLCKDGQIVYVGKSKLLSNRLNTHGNNKEKDFDEVLYIEVETENDAINLEAAFIKWLQPANNKTIPTIERAETFIIETLSKNKSDFEK